MCVYAHLYISTGVEPQVIVAHESALPAAGDHRMDEKSSARNSRWTTGHRICASVMQAAGVTELVLVSL